jgi:hypothetical protein
VWREWLRLPAGTLEQLIEYRGYARAKAIYQQNPQADGAMVQLVKVITFELAQDRITHG